MQEPRQPLKIPNAQSEESLLQIEISDARIDLRGYLIKKGRSDLVEIRLIEQLLKEDSIKIDQVPELVKNASEIGRTLVEQAIFEGLAQENQATAILAEINNIDTVSLSNESIEEEHAHLISFDEASKWRALPYKRNKFGHLLVAISDPESIEVREDIQKRLPEEIIVFQLVGPNELEIFIDKIYNQAASGAISDIASEAEETDEYFTDTIHARETDYSAPIIRLVDEIIKGAVVAGASDVHIESHENYALVRYRVDSLLRDIKQIQKHLEPKVISRIKNIANMKPDERRVPQDGRVSIKSDGRQIDLRVATLPVVHGEQATIRLLDSSQAMVNLANLGMSEEHIDRYIEAIRKPHGCCFITGPTGSGKSTTLYSSLNQVLDNEKKIMTLEDPVEYRLEGISQTDLSGGIRSGEDRMGFATVLKSILRSDPDVIMVGEIRDEETARIAIDASLTGHFLYSTLHTNDALSSITRLERMGVERFLIAAATEVIVAQRLVRKLCRCRVQTDTEQELLTSNNFQSSFVDKIKNTDYKDRVIYKPNPTGCVECAGTGYRGRTAVHEIITVTEEMRSAIDRGDNLEQLEKLARRSGFGSLLDDGFNKVLDGQTSFEEIARVVL